MSDLWLVSPMPSEVQLAKRPRGAKDLDLPEPSGGWSHGRGGLAWTGVGRKATVACLEALAAGGARRVLHLGCAGALRPGTQPGDAFRVTAAHQVDEGRLECPGEEALWSSLAASGLQLKEAEAFTVRKVASTHAAKQALADQVQAATLVEMETFWAVQAAQRLGMTLSCVRVVIDPFERDLPDLSHVLDARGKPKIFGLMKFVLKKPSRIAGLVETGNAFGLAQQRLGQIANAALR